MNGRFRTGLARGPLYQFYAQFLKKKDDIESEIQSQESISSEENGF